MSPNTPLALGIHWAHDASVAICTPDGIVCAIQEERLTRVKHHYGFPRRAIEKALKYSGLAGRDIDYFAISTHNVFYPDHSNYMIVHADGTSDSKVTAGQTQGWRDWLRATLADEFDWARFPKAPDSRKADAMIASTWGEFADRHYLNQQEFLADLGLMDKRVRHYYVAHHRAHAASAFRLSGLPEACVITMDGKGDGLSATIYKGQRDGRLELLRSSSAADSLGAFYQAITEALGFVPVDGEYKTMGLAAFGHANGTANPFTKVISVNDGVLKSQVAWTYSSYNERHPDKQVPNPLSSVTQADEYKRLLDGLSREQFAFFAQAHCEEVMLAYARDALRISGCGDLLAAGGVMLNVKANALIRDQLQPASYFVFPDAADSGLAAGAAMEALYQAGALQQQPARFQIPYLGHSYRDPEIQQEIANFQERHALAVKPAGPGQLADLLVEGKVIGTFQGRLEMGPRALGNRSVLADARSATTKDRINLILKGREWFVPFAPAVLEEDARLYWGGSVDYQYMTFAVSGNDYACQTVPAVVHFDGSMRPQVVSAEFNPWLYAVLQAYKQRTGIGVLLNTSFNRHGLPIVSSPADALEHLVQGWVDGLALGPWYVERTV